MRTSVALLWLALIAMWLLLNETVGLGQVLVGALVAWVGLYARALLQPASAELRRPRAAVALMGIVAADIVHSNVAVAALVLRGRRRHASGFVEIPLATRHPAALAALACIITATPGTAWAGYDRQANLLTMHVLDLVDPAASVRAIKDRYERRLMEIFE